MTLWGQNLGYLGFLKKSGILLCIGAINRIRDIQLETKLQWMGKKHI